MRQTFATSSFNNWYLFYLFLFLTFYPTTTWDGNINYDSFSIRVINKDNVWSSCPNFLVTLDCEIPQYLEIFTFHHSLQLLYAPVISSFQSTYTTKLPMAIPWHVIMFSNTFYSHGPPLSLTSAHSVWKEFCCAINGKSRTICSQRLFLGTSDVIYQQIPSFPLTYCSFILFPSILSSSPLLHLFILLSIHCV